MVAAITDGTFIMKVEFAIGMEVDLYCAFDCVDGARGKKF
jgi:hypothetical protein